MPDGESGGQITVSSTTDTLKAVQGAADGSAFETPARSSDHSADQKAALDEKPRMVASTTDSESAIKEVEQDLREEQAEKRDQYLGRSRRKLIGQVSRLHQQNDQLRARVEQLERGHQPAPQQPHNGNRDQQQAIEQQQQPQQLPDDPGMRDFAQRYQEAQQRMPELAKAAREKYGEGLQQELTENGEVPMAAYLHILTTAQNPIDVAVHLARHPETRAKLFALEAKGRGVEMLQELDYISRRLREPEAEAGRQRTRTQAPAPIVPVNGASTRSAANPSEMDYQTYKKWRNAGHGGR
jgi:hypothetical protein